MNIEALRHFLAVAKEENITAAANSLFISQPQLSRELLSLENELGKKLLVRGKRKTTLTPDGVILRSRASEIIRLVEMTKSEISLSDQSFQGNISVGCAESVAMRFFASVATNFRNNYPGIHYYIRSGTTEALIELLERGLLDFGIFVGESDIKKFNHFPLPTYDVWGILMPREHHLATKQSIQASDLLGVPLLVSEQLFRYNELTSWFGPLADSLNIVATYDLIFNASLMVEEGMGCALSLSPLVGTPENEPLVFRPLSPPMVSKLQIAWNHHRRFSAPAQHFLESIKNEINNNTYTQTEYYF